MLLSLIPTFLDACLDASIRPIRPPCTHFSIPCLAPHIRDGVDCVEARCPHRSACRLCSSLSGGCSPTSIFTSIRSEVGLFVWDCTPYLVSLATFVVLQNWSLVDVWEDWFENGYCKSQVDEFEERVRDTWESVLQLKSLGISSTTNRERLKRVERANERMVDYLISVRRAREEGRVRYRDVVPTPEFRAYYTRWSGVCVERMRSVAKEEARVRMQRWEGDVNLNVEEVEMFSRESTPSRTVRYADAFLSKADTLCTKRQFAGAEEFYTKYLALTAPAIGASNSKADEGSSPTYVKVLVHRARARETLGKLDGALQDYIVASMLASSEDLGLAVEVEHLMGQLARKDVPTLRKERAETLPSPNKVFASLKAIPLQAPQLPETPSLGDETLELAFYALQAEDYALSFTLVNEALAQDISSDEGVACGLSLRGVFRLLCGQTVSAQADLHSAALFSSNRSAAASAAIALAYTYLALGDPLRALERLDRASKDGPQNCDVHYHRGLLLLNDLGEFAASVDAFQSCIAVLKDTAEAEGMRKELLASATANLGVGLYRAGEVERSLGIFRDAERDFPGSEEALMYHAECLRHEGRFDEALAKCDKAIELEKRKRHPSASCLIIKANILSHSTPQDLHATEACYLEALKLDADHTGILDALAQLYTQWGKHEEALGVRRRQVGVVRQKGELERVMRELYTLEAQVNFFQAFPAYGLAR